MTEAKPVKLEDIVTSLHADPELGIKTHAEKDALRQIAEQYAELVNSMSFKGPNVGGAEMRFSPVALDASGEKVVNHQIATQFSERVKQAYQSLMSHTQPTPAKKPLEPAAKTSDTVQQYAVPLDEVYDLVYNGVLPNGGTIKEQANVRPVVIDVIKRGVEGLAVAENVELVYVTAKDEAEKGVKLDNLVGIVEGEYSGNKKATKRLKAAAGMLETPGKYKGAELQFSAEFAELIKFVNDVFFHPDGKIEKGDITSFVIDHSLKRVRGIDRFVVADELYDTIVAEDKWTDRRKATSDVNSQVSELDANKKKYNDMFTKYVEDPNVLEDIERFLTLLKAQYKPFTPNPRKDGKPRAADDSEVLRSKHNQEYHDDVDGEDDAFKVYDAYMTRQGYELEILRNDLLKYSTTEQHNTELKRKVEAISNDYDELRDLLKQMEADKLFTHGQLSDARKLARALARRTAKAERRASKAEKMKGRWIRWPLKLAAAATVIAAAWRWGVPYAMDYRGEYQKVNAQYGQSLDRFNSTMEETLQRMKRSRDIMNGTIPIEGAPEPEEPGPANNDRVAPPAERNIAPPMPREQATTAYRRSYRRQHK